MNKKINFTKVLSLLMSIVMFSVLFININVDDAEAASIPRVIYEPCIKNIGWQGWSIDGETAGTTGQSKALEGIRIYVENPGMTGSIQYRTYSEGFGWLNWSQDAGLSNDYLYGQVADAQAFQIRLTGQLAQKYDVVYRVHSAYYGWLDWVRNGQTAGRYEEGLRVEAIQVKLVEKANIRSISIGNFNGRDELFMGQFFAAQGIPTSYYTSISKYSVTNAIKQAFANSKESDISYIYLSCHGGVGGYLGCATDGGYFMEELKGILDEIPGTFVIMVDACYSGTLAESGIFNTSGLLGSSKYKIITACSSQQTSGAFDISIATDYWAYGCGYSYYKAGYFPGDVDTLETRANYIYNRCLYKLPADANNDGYVTLNELRNYSNSRDDYYVQRIYPENSDFVMFGMPNNGNYFRTWNY